MSNPTRMWINQPSTFQPHHRLHGTNVLAVREDDTDHRIYRVYFLAGPVVSQQMPATALADGWHDDGTWRTNTDRPWPGGLHQRDGE